MKRFNKILNKWSIYGGLLITVPLFFACLIQGLCYGGGSMVVFQNLALLFAGLVAGWILGTLITPYDSEEQKSFSALTKTVAALFTGYLVGKVDPLLQSVFSREFFSNELYAFRFTILLVAVHGAMIVTFIDRRYQDPGIDTPELRRLKEQIATVSEDQLHYGLSWQQVQLILGKPTKIETSDPLKAEFKVEYDDLLIWFRHGFLENIEKKAAAPQKVPQ